MELRFNAANSAMHEAYDAIQDVTDNLDMRNPQGVKEAVERLVSRVCTLGVTIDVPIMDRAYA